MQNIITTLAPQNVAKILYNKFSTNEPHDTQPHQPQQSTQKQGKYPFLRFYWKFPQIQIHKNFLWIGDDLMLQASSQLQINSGNIENIIENDELSNLNENNNQS